MKNAIPILIFLRSLGLTEEKILLSINDSNIFSNLKNDELKTFEKFEEYLGKYIPRTIEGTFILLGEILTGKEHNILSILLKKISNIRLFDIFLIKVFCFLKIFNKIFYYVNLI
jgi:hypothetical protein